MTDEIENTVQEIHYLNFMNITYIVARSRLNYEVDRTYNY